ncbi:VWA domain-containing protein [Actinacidiphila epipremni]|uniref:VWA domain-containing protein n=1 Tax=Actinacidiphila epipremni TaxID=2053013 RepID=A0ABX0ZQW1_9ACTN|nr:VWA domain-containing protein [Actinacidiphila epipremni]NJP45392.1 VWA domain-containing protein [Actinacidiphila epipremni]
MATSTPERLPLAGLLGVAFDVSGSMRASVENAAAGPATGLGALRETVERLTDRGLAAFTAAYPSGVTTSLDVFAYAFGLRGADGGNGVGAARKMADVLFGSRGRSILQHLADGLAEGLARPSPLPVVCDLLSVLAAVQSAGGEPKEQPVPEPPGAAPPSGPGGPGTEWDAELARIATEHQCHGWDRLARVLLPDPEQIRNLVLRLRAEPALAAQLANLLPNASEEEIALMVHSRGSGARAFAAHPLVSARMARSQGADLLALRGNLHQARVLLEELAAPPGTGPSGARTVEDIRRRLIAAVFESAAEIGDTTLPLEEVLARLRRLTTGGGAGGIAVEEIVYGATPLRKAMERTADRFAAELAARPAGTPATFVLVSDGDSTDGDPTQALARIAAQGVTVVACHLTTRDLTRPRTLLAEPGRDWPAGAATMFAAASTLPGGHPLPARLRAAGWHVPAGARCFVQANHSALVGELLEQVVR